MYESGTLNVLEVLSLRKIFVCSKNLSFREQFSFQGLLSLLVVEKIFSRLYEVKISEPLRRRTPLFIEWSGELHGFELGWSFSQIP